MKNKFTITITRIYEVSEDTEITVEANTPDEALALGKRLEFNEGFDDWHEFDGSAQPDSYIWEIFAANDTNKRDCLLKGHGTLDDTDGGVKP